MNESISKRILRGIKNRIPGTARLRVPKVWNDTYKTALGTVKREDDAGISLVKYDGEDGFDYDTYREIQEQGNRAKLHGQWVTRSHVKMLCEFVEKAGITIEKGVCHGTRQGNEQQWFMDALSNEATVFGTEISSTATQFPNTVQWDFHETNTDWIGQFDLVYSNSWDHAYDPEKAFRAWLETLRPGGVLILDHSRYHLPDRANELDPFGAEFNQLCAMIERIGGDSGATIGKLEDKLSDDTTNAPVDLPVVSLIYQKGR